MFDKLSVRFNGRVTFVKDVFVNEEICCWSFFGHTRKVAEISCTSIVYTSEKKQTKVRLTCMQNKFLELLNSFFKC